MSNTRQIPWRRILLEGAVIVVSILLAFSIDAWWNSRIEQQREREQLISMLAEFKASLSGLDGVLTSIQGHAKNVESLIALLKAAGDEPVMVPGALLGSAITWRTSDVSTSTLDALMASGDLNLLRNVELRANLARLPAILLDVTEDEIVAQKFAESEMSVFLAREGLAEIAYANRAGVPDSEAVQNLSVPGEISVLPRPEMIGYLTARRVHFYYSEVGLPIVRSYLELLIEQIDKELTPGELIE
jgi:hypothetical protein